MSDVTQDNLPDCVEITENMGEWFVRVLRDSKARVFTFETQADARSFAAARQTGRTFFTKPSDDKTGAAMRRYPANPDPQSNDQPYDATYLAQKYGLSEKTAEVILFSNGPSRVACDAAARAFVAAMAVRMNYGRD